MPETSRPRKVQGHSPGDPSVPVNGDIEAPPWSPLTIGEQLTPAADPSLRSSPFTLGAHLHQARFTLVRRLLWLLAGVVFSGVAMLVTARWTLLTATEVAAFMIMVFGAVLTLTGAAVGFYFGGEDRHG